MQGEETVKKIGRKDYLNNYKDATNQKKGQAKKVDF